MTEPTAKKFFGSHYEQVKEQLTTICENWTIPNSSQPYEHDRQVEFGKKHDADNNERATAILRGILNDAATNGNGT